MTIATFELSAFGVSHRFTCDNSADALYTYLVKNHSIFLGAKQLNNLLDIGEGIEWMNKGRKVMIKAKVMRIDDKVAFEKALDIIVNAKRYKDAFLAGKISVETLLSIASKANRIADAYGIHRAFK